MARPLFEQRDELAARLQRSRAAWRSSLDSRRDELGRAYDEYRRTHAFAIPPAIDGVAPGALPLTQEVVPGLYQVRTPGARVYLALDDGVTIIDTGNPGAAPRILDAVAELGCGPTDVRTIIITHGHIDHVGSLAELQDLVPAKTAVHRAEADDVRSPVQLPNPFVDARIGRLFEPYLQWRDPGPAHVDIELDDGDQLPVLGGLRVVHVPGHTDGSIALHFVEAGVLLAGDALQYRFGRLMPPNRLFSRDLDRAAASLERIASLDFGILCFSHFRPILSDASRKVRDFVRTQAA